MSRAAARKQFARLVLDARKLLDRFDSVDRLTLLAELDDIVRGTLRTIELLPDDQYATTRDIDASSVKLHPTVKLDPSNFRISTDYKLPDGWQPNEQQLATAVPLVTLVSYHACSKCGFLCPESLAICDDCLPPEEAEQLASDALSAMRGGKSGAV